MLGVVELTRRAIPALRDSGGGVVCNVTSAAVLMPVPFDGAYRASKAAVSALGPVRYSERGWYSPPSMARRTRVFLKIL